jgi:hypothetical protein
MKETELAQHFVDYLAGFDLYFEVDYHRCIDIVALNGNISAAYEVKTSFNFKVLEQAVDNAKYFNFSYVAVPDFNDWMFQRKLCETFGVGLLVYDAKKGYNDVREIVHPKLNRHADNKKLRNKLREYNKMSLPGARSGDTYKVTAFQVTVEDAVRYVRHHPGCSIKEMVSNINHHYGSDRLAAVNLYQWIHKEVIKEIRLENKGLYINPINK